jgi:integrase
MARIALTERRVEALKPDPTGKRRPELRDSVVPSLIVRAAAQRKQFCLHARFPGFKHPTRRAIGEVGTLSIDDAREVARSWLQSIRRGVDPAEEVRQRREAERAALAQRFGEVAELYLVRVVARQRQARSAERIIRSELITRWAARPVSSLTRRDVIAMVEDIDARGAPVYAAACFAQARALFGWCVARDLLEHSPCTNLKVAAFVSRSKQARQRVLGDAEVKAFWVATGELAQPWQGAFRLLLLTGVRKSEALGAKWSEFADLGDPARAVWVVPASRFKSQREHRVPLSPAALAVLAAIPRHQHGDFVFSCTFGRTPALVLHQAKRRLDELMRRELPELPAWQSHDLRRVVRTKLAALGVADAVGEAALGHARRGLPGVYDTHSYLPEVRRALALFADEVARITGGRPDDGKVLPLRGKRR